jgi:hypothetical protein
MTNKSIEQNIEGLQSESLGENRLEIEAGQFAPEQLVSLLRGRLKEGDALLDSFCRQNDVDLEEAPDNSEIKETLMEMRGRAQSLWETAKEKLSRAGAIGLALLAFSGAGEFGPVSAQAAERAPAAAASFESGAKEKNRMG